MIHIIKPARPFSRGASKGGPWSLARAFRGATGGASAVRAVRDRAGGLLRRRGSRRTRGSQRTRSGQCTRVSRSSTSTRSETRRWLLYAQRDPNARDANPGTLGGRPDGERPDCPPPAGPRGKRDARALGSSVQSTTTPGCVSRTKGAERGGAMGGIDDGCVGSAGDAKPDDGSCRSEETRSGCVPMS